LKNCQGLSQGVNLKVARGIDEFNEVGVAYYRAIVDDWAAEFLGELVTRLKAITERLVAIDKRVKQLQDKLSVA
jgi:hypothetical protein